MSPNNNPFHVPNFRRHAVESLLKSRSGLTKAALRPLWDQKIAALSNTEAVSFLLPLNGEIIRHDTVATLSFEGVHLPFPRCAIEYPISPEWYFERRQDKEYPSAAILLLEQPHEERIELGVIWRIEMEGDPVWVPSVKKIALIPSTTVYVGSQGRRTKVSLQNIEVSRPDELSMLLEEPNDLSESADELRVLAHFVLLCNCDNVRPERIYSPPAALQKRAAQRGRPAFNEYYALNINLPSQAGRGEGGEGSGSSVRFHVRRGHIRRLQSGRRTWVRQCAVGDPSLGEIHKDYRVRTLAHSG